MADGLRSLHLVGDRALHLLRSARLAIWLFLGVALLSISGTVFPPARASQFFRSLPGPDLLPVARAVGLVDPYHSPLFAGLLALLCTNIAMCTARRWRRPSLLHQRSPRAGSRLRFWSDLLMHISLIVLMAGAAAKGFWGFTATQNILPGKPQQTVFDVRTETDVPLGFTILLRDIEETYYPIRARIGVKNASSGEKVALLEVTEGRPADVPGAGLTLALERYDPRRETVLFAVTQGRQKGSFSLETRQGGEFTAAAAGHAFTLVAYSRELRNVRGLVTIVDEGRPDRTVWISPTSGITHRGTNLYQTAWGVHPELGRYLGLQVSRDPFAPLFWGGCTLLCLSLPLFVISRLRQTERQSGGRPAP